MEWTETCPDSLAAHLSEGRGQNQIFFQCPFLFWVFTYLKFNSTNKI